MSDVIDRLNAALSGRYVIERVLGEGGMATVYLAHDERHDRPVAIKVLRPELAAVLGGERFLEEIRTTANLQHPHILPLHDSGKADGFLFYVMPYAPGESLRDRLRREGPLGVERAIAITTRLGQALAHAHGQGVIHRDIKPANVLLSGGEPLLADFGIARAIARDPGSHLTRTGASVGTPGYMSPEQLAGEAVDARSDIFSLGALTYEMLTGSAPFAGQSGPVAVGRLMADGPPDATAENPAVPAQVSAVVSAALAADPAARPASATEFVDRLRAASAPVLATKGRGPLWWAVATAVLAAAAAGFWFNATRQERRARNQLLPEVQRLLTDGQASRAFDVAQEARAVIPDDPVLADLFEAVAVPLDFITDPPGATASYRPFDPDDTVWTVVGTTPLRDVRVPAEELLVRLELEGYQPHTASLSPTWGLIEARLTPSDAGAMVWVPAGEYERTGSRVPVPAFYLDRHEVTNAEYLAFLSSGLDWQPEVWVEPLSDRGIEIDEARVRSQFVDETGRPGPAGWALSRYPDGEDRLPVQGVSWFEAVAYCHAQGKELPTYYHWKYADAAVMSPFDGLLQHANIAGGSAALPVESTEAYGVYGIADMAGNVSEWVWNAAGTDRYLLGGAWESPPHLYTDYDAADPWSRDPEKGFRCARYEEAPDAELLASIDLPIFDFSGYEPVDDATYAQYLTFYEYDPAPLDETRTVVREAESWTREYVEVDAAYPGERLPIHVFLPTNTEPPYQSVVYFPGGAAFFLTSSRNVKEMSELEFIPESGRAILFPVLHATFERSLPPPQGMAARRQEEVRRVQDIMRTVDFIQDQPDFDSQRIGYMGLSYGAELAVPVAVEKRFAAAVLIGAALDPAWIGVVPEQMAPWNFVSRITTPTIVINGEFDFMHPLEESQIPFYQMIDVQEPDKELVILPTGHVPPNNEVIGHALRWLDEHLGRVSLTGVP